MRQPEKPMPAAYWGLFIGFCVLYFDLFSFAVNTCILAAIILGFAVSRSPQQRKMLREFGDRLEAWRDEMRGRISS
jgi:hypothetical protein